ncbi:hypothetical protein HD806DRAFT_168803 [Xylariaceae sp. AK1471]|nr:hypothetical protein HD806DRAFT_168803 [Xylariaceae sp. AK1471]
MASGSKDPGRGITSLTSLSELFINPSLDKGSLASLRECNSWDVAQCLRLCFDWCKQEIWKHNAQLPSPFRKGKELEIDSSDSDYQYDVSIFIYLLDRFIRSPRTTSDRDRWDDRAKGTIPFCPIMILFTMSSLIVTAANTTLVSYQGATLSTPPPPPSSIFEFAKQGMDLIDDESNGIRWNAGKIVKEFCLEFQSMLRSYTEYGKAAKGAVDRYVAQNWPENKVNEEQEFSAEEEEDYVGSLNGMFSLDDQFEFQGE